MIEIDQLEWVERVRQGDFAGMPASFCWDSSAEFAHLINGYTVTECFGLGSLEDAWRCLSQRYDTSGQWRGSVIELWSALFRLHRAARFCEGSVLSGGCEDQLCKALRDALQHVDDATRSLLVALIAEERDRLSCV